MIVVDNGSTDATRDEVALIRDPRVRVIAGPGRSVGEARNLILRCTHVDWIAWLDADDRWLAGHFSALARTLMQSPDAVACFGAARHVDEDGRLLRIFCMPAQHANLEGLLRRKLQPTTSATAVRRDVAMSVGGFFEHFRVGVEDIDLWWRLAKEGPCTVQPAPLTEYVVHTSRDRSRSRNFLLDLRADRETCIERLAGEVNPDLFHRAAASHYAILARYWLVAGHHAEARRDAISSLRHRATVDGIAAFLSSLLPTRAFNAVRRARQSWARVAAPK